MKTTAAMVFGAFALVLSLYAQAENLARGKPARQSSEAFGGPAGRAVDGNPNGHWPHGSVTHTQAGPQPWWEVDLGGANAIDEIRVWNRTDCCSERLSNFWVLVSDRPLPSDLGNARRQAAWSQHHPGRAFPSATFRVGRPGRHVRVQLAGNDYLSLAEVEVLGKPAPGQKQAEPAGKPAEPEGPPDADALEIPEKVPEIAEQADKLSLRPQSLPEGLNEDPRSEVVAELMKAEAVANEKPVDEAALRAAEKKSEADVEAIGDSSKSLESKSPEELEKMAEADLAQRAATMQQMDKQGGRKAKAAKGIEKAFQPILGFAMKFLSDKVLTLTSRLAATAGIDISLVTQMASFVKDGKLDTQRITTALTKFVLNLLFDRLKPMAKELVTKAIDYLRKFTDRVLTAVSSSLAAIPFVGGSLVLGAHQAYSFGMEKLQDLVLNKGLDLLKKLANKLVGKIAQKLLGPALKSVNKFLARNKVGKFISKGLKLVEKIPQGLAKVKALVAKFSGAAPAVRSEAEQWAAESVAASFDLEAAKRLAGFGAGKKR